MENTQLQPLASTQACTRQHTQRHMQTYTTHNDACTNKNKKLTSTGHFLCAGHFYNVLHVLTHLIPKISPGYHQNLIIKINKYKALGTHIGSYLSNCLYIIYINFSLPSI